MTIRYQASHEQFAPKDNTGIGTILNDDGTAIAALTKDESSTRTMRISTNPATSLVNVHLQGYKGSITLQLMDILDKVLKEYKVQTDNVKYAQHQVDVSGVVSSVYLVIALDEKGNRQSQKLIVAR